MSQSRQDFLVKAFGSNLKQLRKESNWTLRELAEAADVSFTYLSKIENGKEPPPSEKLLKKLATILGVNEFLLIRRAGKVPFQYAEALLDAGEFRHFGLKYGLLPYPNPHDLKSKINGLQFAQAQQAILEDRLAALKLLDEAGVWTGADESLADRVSFLIAEEKHLREKLKNV